MKKLLLLVLFLSSLQLHSQEASITDTIITLHPETFEKRVIIVKHGYVILERQLETGEGEDLGFSIKYPVVDTITTFDPTPPYQATVTVMKDGDLVFKKKFEKRVNPNVRKMKWEDNELFQTVDTVRMIDAETVKESIHSLRGLKKSN